MGPAAESLRRGTGATDLGQGRKRSGQVAMEKGRDSMARHSKLFWVSNSVSCFWFVDMDMTWTWSLGDHGHGHDVIGGSASAPESPKKGV